MSCVPAARPTWPVKHAQCSSALYPHPLLRICCQPRLKSSFEMIVFPNVVAPVAKDRDAQNVIDLYRDYVGTRLQVYRKSELVERWKYTVAFLALATSAAQKYRVPIWHRSKVFLKSKYQTQKNSRAVVMLIWPSLRTPTRLKRLTRHQVAYQVADLTGCRALLRFSI